MKVVQINAFYKDGSTGVIVKDLHNLSLKSGIDSYVVFSSTSCDLDEIVNPYVMGNFVSNKLHALLSRVNGRQGYFSKSSTKKLLEYLDENSLFIDLENILYSSASLTFLISCSSGINTKLFWK